MKGNIKCTYDVLIDIVQDITQKPLCHRLPGDTFGKDQPRLHGINYPVIPIA